MEVLEYFETLTSDNLNDILKKKSGLNRETFSVMKITTI